MAQGSTSFQHLFLQGRLHLVAQKKASEAEVRHPEKRWSIEYGTSLQKAHTLKSIRPWDRSMTCVGSRFLTMSHKMNWKRGATALSQMRGAQLTRGFFDLIESHADATEKEPDG